MKTLAKYRCLKCGFLWEGNPGPTQCPKCQHLYVKWKNIDKMRKEWGNE